ncbi:hypothetical protein LVJ94_02160 [Pendulispora rubella]|uniref:Uncharacterized protein n=1 Tax=Pendulispora rubella TaxID=2741070 RepID=A0ABZ2L550_9BACT
MNHPIRWVALVLAVGIAGCPTASARRGLVMNPLDERESRVRFYSPAEVREGDTLHIFRDKCGTTTRGPISANCRMTPIGQGTIVRVIDSHEVTMQSEPGLTVKQGDTVERNSP